MRSVALGDRDDLVERVFVHGLPRYGDLHALETCSERSLLLTPAAQSFLDRHEHITTDGEWQPRTKLIRIIGRYA
jgi:hypothetical protein